MLGQPQVEHELVGILPAEQESLEQCFDDGVGRIGDRNRDPCRCRDLPVLADEDVKDDAVDAGIDAVDRHRLHDLGLLPEAVDPALALLVPGRVPGEVVVDYCLKPLLKVHALTQAVGRHEDAATISLGEVSDPLGALRRRKGAGDGHDGDRFLQLIGEVGSDILGGVDEPAEHDRVETVLQQGVHLLDQCCELGILLRAGQGIGLACEREQASAMRGWAVVDRIVRAWDRIDGLHGIVVGTVEHCCPANGVGLVDIARPRTGSTRPEGRCGRDRRTGQRAQQRQRRPPPHPLAGGRALARLHLLAGVGEDLVEQCPVLGGQRVGGLEGLAVLRERGLLGEEGANVSTSALDEVLSEEGSPIGVVEVDGRQTRIEEPEQVAKALLLAGVRRSGHQDQVSIGVGRELAQQLVALVG